MSVSSNVAQCAAARRLFYHRGGAGASVVESESMADSKLSDSERFSIRIASEARAFANGDLIEEPYTQKWVPNPERVGVLDRIEEDVRAEAQLLQTVRSAYVHMVNNNFLRDIQRQLNSPSIQSAIKSFQAEARIVWPNADSPQSKLTYRVEPTQPKIEQRPSGIAVVDLTIVKSSIDNLDYSQKRKLYDYLESQLSGKMKPGPVPPSPEEMIEMVEHFMKTGLTQNPYCEIYSVTRYSLQQSIRWYRANVGDV